MLLNCQDFIHESDLELIFLVGQLRRVAETLKQHYLLRCHLGLDCVSYHSQHNALVEVNWGVFKLIELVSYLSCQLDVFDSLGCHKFLAPFGLLSHMLLDELVG